MPIIATNKKYAYYHLIDAPLLQLLQPPITQNFTCQLHFHCHAPNTYTCEEAATLQYIDTAFPQSLAQSLHHSYLKGQRSLVLAQALVEHPLPTHIWRRFALLMNLKKLPTQYLDDGSCIIFLASPLRLIEDKLLHGTRLLFTPQYSPEHISFTTSIKL